MAKPIHHSGHNCPKCRRRWAQVCDGRGLDPRCGTTTKHRHCCCGLAMAADAEMCELCVLEGLVATEYDEAAWDGETYPSFRRHRTEAPEPALYVTLFRAATEGAGLALRESW